MGAARTMLVTFGALAFGLSMIGLYAALAFAVGERTREMNPRDPLAFTVGPAVLTVVAPLAISLPARRAMQQNPIVALQAE